MRKTLLTSLFAGSLALAGLAAANAQVVSTMIWKNLASLAGTVATATGTTEQTLATYSLPAKALVTNGQRVHIYAHFSKAANIDSVTCKLYFGSESYSSGANTTSAAPMWLAMDVVRTGSKTQVVTAHGALNTTMVAPTSQAGAEDDTSAITIKATCTDGTSAASDAVLQDFRVDAAM